MDSDFGEERPALDAVPDSKAMANHHSSYNCIFNTIDTLIGEESYYASQCAGEFREMSSRNVFGGGPASIMGNVDGPFYADLSFAAKFLQKPNLSALMAAETSDADALLDCSRDSGDGVGIEGRSVSILTSSVNVNPGGVENGVNSTGWGPSDAAKLGADVSKFGIGNVPTSTWTNFPSDPAFVERAVKFSSFGNAECISPENVASGVSNLRAVAEQGGPENANASAEPAKSAEDGLGRKKRTKSSSSGQNNAKEPEENKAKRCRVGENSESDDNTYNEDTSDSTPKKGKDKIAKSVQKEDNYIHVRARRGQATDSHSLAERVRREKINERMKFLQDLVPTCNKVTGKAVMLDEIINYVQSLQHQVEFLSMKLATVNPKLDFNIDSFLAKEMCGNFPSKGVASPYFHKDQFKQASFQPGPSPGSDILSAISSADSVEMFDGANFQISTAFLHI